MRNLIECYVTTTETYPLNICYISKSVLYSLSTVGYDYINSEPICKHFNHLQLHMNSKVGIADRTRVYYVLKLKSGNEHDNIILNNNVQ